MTLRWQYNLLKFREFAPQTRGNRGGKVNSKGGAGAGRAVDCQPAAMPVENVFDQCQAEAGAALSAALGDIYAIKSLGQPRQMLGRDARAKIAHALLSASGSPSAEAPGPNLNVDAPASGAVFERILDEVLKDADQFIVIAQDRQRIRSV